MTDIRKHSGLTLKAANEVLRDFYLPTIRDQLSQPNLFMQEALNPWPIIILFPRLHAVTEAIKRRRYRVRWWYREHLLEAIDVLRHGRQDDW